MNEDGAALMSDLTRFRDVSHRGIAQSPIVISSPDSGDNGLERRASGPAEGDTGAARKRRNLATKITITSNSKPTCEQEPDSESQPQLLSCTTPLFSTDCIWLVRISGRLTVNIDK